MGEKFEASDAQKSEQITKLTQSSEKQSSKIASLQQDLQHKSGQVDTLTQVREDLQASIGKLSEELNALREWKDERLKDVEHARAKFLDKVAVLRETEGRIG